MDRRLLVLALGMFALGTDSFVIAGVLQEIASGFGVSVAAAGQMTTIYAVTLAILAPVIAALAAHVPRKQLLLSGLAVFVVANLGTAVAPNFEIAMATRALAGLGAAMFFPTATGSAASIVPTERRGVALSVVATGMTISTVLGSPIGALIGGIANWHWTMVFVSALAALSAIGVMAFLSQIPMPPAVTLRKRLEPLADARIGLALCTTFLFFTAAFTIYTYFAIVFDRAIGGNAKVLAALLMVWGAAGTLSNLLVGRLIDAIGNRKVLATTLVLVVANFILMPWTAAQLGTAVVAILFWGACGWGSSVPQQHRIVSIAPQIAPIVLGLNNSAVFLGATAAGVVGAVGIEMFGAEKLPFIAAAITGAAILASELAVRKIAASKPNDATAAAHEPAPGKA
jgi:predicted MFS family arabinose efflux permease